MGGTSSEDSRAPVSEENDQDRLESEVWPQELEASSSDQLAPSASIYVVLAVALLACAILLAVATVVPGTILHVNGVAAMVISAVATLLAAGALLALRSALAARRHRI
jgi:hypothetical protein